MNVIKPEIEAAVEKELAAATERFGLHHSHHEKMAVIGEEFEESMETLDELKSKVIKAWMRTRENCDSDIMCDAYGRIYDKAVDLACEAVQVAAMCRKAVEHETD